MHTAPAARKITLSALAALTLLAGALFLAAVATPKASAAGCNYMQVCIWTGTFQRGQISWWPARDRGCHTHAGNRDIWSSFNNTPYTVTIGTSATLPPYTGHNDYSPITFLTGDVCW